MKWPFGRQKAPHELGEDVPTVISELKARKHWKDLPAAAIQRFSANATYVFDRPGEAADSLKRLVLVLELNSFRRSLQKIARAEEWRKNIFDLSRRLSCVAAQHKQSVLSAQTDLKIQSALFAADSAAVASLVCERYAMGSYCLLAQLSFGINDTPQEAALWCNRYRRAESDLLCKVESSLDPSERAIRKMLDPAKLRDTAEEMRRVLPKCLLQSLPGFNSENPVTSDEVVEQIEELISIQEVT